MTAIRARPHCAKLRELASETGRQNWQETQGDNKVMRAAQKSFFLVSITAILVLVGGCSGLPGGSSGTGPTGGPFTIGGTITGLSGTGLVLQDNGANNLAISANSSFVFGTTIASGGTYAVTVSTQPSNPTQTCAVVGGTGTATANVTAIAVNCTTNPVTATIGGNITGLVANSSVILQDNGGDALTLTANGAFTFKTPVTGADIYAVTVATQPASPNQICTVTGGSGVATANVTSVAVNCVLSYSIGGTVTGVVGTGLILQNSSDSEQLTISPANGNQAFTFTQLVPTGTMYAVTILDQPTNPTQACTITTGTGTGTATANVTSIAIVCPAVTYSVGGIVAGLAGVPTTNGVLTDNSFIVENNLGNTLGITANGPFTFATPEALNDQYSISIFHGPSTQAQGCTRWNYKGVVTQTITSIVVDCGHDDWTWIAGSNLAGSTIGQPLYGAFLGSAPTTEPNPFTNSPGGRYGAAGWTDASGNMWLFGGYGWELSGSSTPDTLPGVMNDLWVCVLEEDYCQWQLVGGYDPAVVGTPPNQTTVGAEVIANAQHEEQVFGSLGAPPARLGAATWTDKNGDLWLFGGSDINNYRNDLWKFNASAFGGYDPSTYTATPGTWTFEAGSSSFDQFGSYPPNAPSPGARTNPLTWVDASGNLWMFGGYGWDGAGTLGYLNDLWEYTGGAWTFVSGTSLANQGGVGYATPGTGSTSNVPGGRHEAAGWADANGNLWLFGGEGEDGKTPVPTPNGILNDLWFYNIASKEWTYVMGNTAANQTGVYPAQTVVGPVNTTGAASTCGLSQGLTSGGNIICNSVSLTGAQPGSRWGAASWIDAGGNFYLFGGWGLDSTGTNGNGALNDTWVYTPSSTPGTPGTWAWVKGSNTGSQNGIYGAGNGGSLTRPYVTYYIFTPGGRSNATHWVDGEGQLYLFGGEGYDSTSTTGNGYLNDMWRYLPYRDF
jgi:Galactose oxidase, central domain